MCQQQQNHQTQSSQFKKKNEILDVNSKKICANP